MSRAKSSASHPSLARNRPSAIRSDFLFPPAVDSSTTSPTPASASLGGQSRLSIRPFDIRDSDADDPSLHSHSSIKADSPSTLTRRRSTLYQVSCAPHLHPTPANPGYSVSGLGTSGFTYSTRERRRPPELLSDDDRLRWKEIAPEDALRALELDYAHTLRVKLKRDTRTQLTAAMRQEIGEIDRTVLRLCDTGQLSSKVAVFQVLDSNTSAADLQYTLVTKSALKQYEPVLAVMGTLRERESYEAWCGGHRAIAMLHAIDIDPAEMPPSYRGPDLLLDTAHYTNEVRFLRDPRFSHRQVEANVEARLVWHYAAGLPYVVFVTLQALPAGVELWKRWDVESREVAWRVQMKYAAKRSHCQHHYIAQLQHQCRLHSLPLIPPSLLSHRDAADLPADDEKQQLRASHLPSLPAKAGPYIPFTWRQSESWTLHHVCAHAIQEATLRENRRLRKKRRLLSDLKRGVVPPVDQATAASIRREEDAARLPRYDFALLPEEGVAYAASHCRPLTQNDWSGISDEVLEQLTVKYRQHEREAARLMEDVKAARRSGTVAKAAIHRVISLHHPARFYAPPCHRSFALVATQPMKRAGCIGAYVGQVRTLNDYNASANPFSAVYTYNLDPLGLDLVIDSLQAGNALRFMNDCFSRAGGPRTCNAQPRYLFDAETRRPNCFILCTAKAGIKKGEEIVTDYGRAYWNRICRALLSEHGRYGDQARALIEALVRQLTEAGVEVPQAKEWREVKEDEFREDAVVWPTFGGGEEEEESDDDEEVREEERWRAEEKEEGEATTLAVKIGPDQQKEAEEGRAAVKDEAEGAKRPPVRKRRPREPPAQEPAKRTRGARRSKKEEGESVEGEQEEKARGKKEDGEEEAEEKRGRDDDMTDDLRSGLSSGVPIVLNDGGREHKEAFREEATENGR